MTHCPGKAQILSFCLAFLKIWSIGNIEQNSSVGRIVMWHSLVQKCINLIFLPIRKFFTHGCFWSTNLLRCNPIVPMNLQKLSTFEKTATIIQAFLLLLLPLRQSFFAKQCWVMCGNFYDLVRGLESWSWTHFLSSRVLASNHGSWTMLIKSKWFYSVHIKFKLQASETCRGKNNKVLTYLIKLNSSRNSGPSASGRGEKKMLSHFSSLEYILYYE